MQKIKLLEDKFFPGCLWLLHIWRGLPLATTLIDAFEHAKAITNTEINKREAFLDLWEKMGAMR